MTAKEYKAQVLIVGGFPPVQIRKVYGGQVSVCSRLLESSFIERYDVCTVDSTQISNPPPAFATRIFLAGMRIARFLGAVIFQRPNVVIIFLAEGASAIEKGVMSRLAQACGVRSLVFPRAGGIMRQYTSSPWFAAFLRNTLGRADMFLCQGLAFQRFAISELGFTIESAPIIPNWTASEEHLRIGVDRDFGRQKKNLQILFLGWLEDFKGIFELLEAARILRDERIEFHLFLGGDGTGLPKAQLFVQMHELDRHVTFAGWLDQAAKADLLLQCQIFTLPSWSEGLPNVMIEAMSAGLACVVTNVGTIPDYVTDGQDALIVEQKNALALAAALRALICDEKLRESLAKNGFRLASSNFTLENGIELLSAAVTRALKSQR
jgi:glycosyltransferase involved in cell wall biosynthesis